VHRLGHGRTGDEVATELREHDAFADGIRLVAATANALQAARHRGRRFDLHDEIDRAHVDAELERGGRDEGAQRSRLEQVLDFDPLRPRDRPVVRSDECFAGEIVQGAGQALGEPPAVHENERRSMRSNQLEQAWVNGRPD